MISMYRQGLNPQNSCGLAVIRLYHMADAVQVAFQMEGEMQKKTPVLPPTDTITRSERTSVEPIRSKLPNRSSHSTLSPSQSSYGGNIKSKCFNCQGFGHRAQDHPFPKFNMPLNLLL